MHVHTAMPTRLASQNIGFSIVYYPRPICMPCPQEDCQLQLEWQPVARMLQPSFCTFKSLMYACLIVQVYCKSFQAAPRELLAKFMSTDGIAWLPSIGVPPLTYLPISADDLLPGHQVVPGYQP